MSVAGPSSRERIGPYTIVARVGAGGMGEVFKAWDPRLERDVAIKLLHPEMAGDPDRQRRLVAEGRAASALNHPSIVRVYDADVDGASYYLVTEWLEGKSLRDELSRGPLPLKRLLDLAVQIADGLAAAHAVGIVHRDIKPENVMLARDGTARIVDFGLARSDPRAPGMSAVIGDAATVTASIEGLSGTPAYMSPEQARGTAGDFRTDQFSFGALVYEMATGQHAFRRDSMADTLSAVLHDEPRPIVEQNARLPAPVRWIIERCLSKDAGDRYSATDDLARELRWIRDRLSEALVEPKLAPASAPVIRGWRLIAAAVVAAVAGAMGVLGLMSLEPEPASPRYVPFASASSYEGEPSWSPDGQSVAYTADVDGVLQVFVKRVGDALSRQLTLGQFDASHPFWTRNGERVYYISQAGEFESLWSVGVAGGRPELVLENVSRADIDPDGTRLALLRVDPDAAMRQTLWWSSPQGETPQREQRAPFDRLRTGGDGMVRFSGDGQLLVWIYDVDTINPNPALGSGFYLVRGTGAVRQVLDALPRVSSVPQFAWLADNRQVVVSLPDASGGNRHLWTADTVAGTARQITAGHTNETAPAVAPAGGRIAYASEEVDFDLTLIAPDGSSRRTMLATARNEFDPVWSPTGDQFAFVTDRSGSVEIWTRSRDGQWERPIVTAADFGASRTEALGSLAFSPDGRTLAYQRGAEGTWDVWLSPVTGGAPIRLTSTPIETSNRPWRDAPTWSPDGEWIAYLDNDAGKMSLIKARVGTNERVELMQGVVAFSRPAWSPDGQWIATQNDDGLVRIPSGGGKPELITAAPNLGVTWRSDGRLVALTESETPGHFAMVEINAATGDSRLLNADLGSIPIANQPIRGFSFTGAQGFLTSLASARSDIWLIEGFQSRRRGLFGWRR